MPGGRLPPDCPPPTSSPQSTQLKDEEARLAEIKRQREELERTRVQAETEAEQAKLEAEKERLASIRRQQEETARLAKVQAETQAEQARLEAERERIAEIKRQQEEANRVARAQARTQVASTSALIHGRYQDHGDGTVTDVVNHLRWKRCAEGQTWTGGTCAGEATTYTWNELPTFSGGWRVPTIEEAKTLLYCRSTGRWGESLTVNRNSYWNESSDSEKRVCGKDIHSASDNSAIDKKVFVNTPLWIWTSSEYAHDAGFALVVDFGDGYVDGSVKNKHLAVRVVSSSQ
ncbi:hypothetical protein CCP3SC1AL1_4330002 [Gammaproteobacteria bacterium]